MGQTGLILGLLAGGGAFAVSQEVLKHDVKLSGLIAGASFALLFGLVMVIEGVNSCAGGRRPKPASGKKKKKKSKKSKSSKAKGTSGKAGKTKTATPAKKEAAATAVKKGKKAKKKSQPKGKKGKQQRPKYESEEEDDDAILFAKTELPVSESELRRRKIINTAEPTSNSRRGESKKAASKPSGPDKDGFTMAGPKKSRRGGGGKKKAPQQQQQQVIKGTPGDLRVSMPVDPRHYGLLIGPGGSTLQALMAGTDTRIDIPKRDSGLTEVVITGTEVVNVKKCQTAIKSLINKGFSSVTHQGMVSGEIACEPRLIGVVIGPNGKHIKAIMEQTNTKVIMPDRRSDSNRIVISGSLDDVKKAKAAIKSIIQKGYSTLTHPEYSSIEVEFPSAMLNLLIGVRGSTIKSIQGDTNTKINIPDPSNPNQNVEVVGEPKGLAAAKKQILRLLDKEAAMRAAPVEDSAADAFDEDYGDYTTEESAYAPPPRTETSGLVWTD